MERRAKSAVKPATREDWKKQRPMQEAMEELEQSNAKHHPRRRLMLCDCGSCAFAVWADPDLNLGGVQCVVCGAIPDGGLSL